MVEDAPAFRLKLVMSNTLQQNQDRSDSVHGRLTALYPDGKSAFLLSMYRGDELANVGGSEAFLFASKLPDLPLLHGCSLFTLNLLGHLLLTRYDPENPTPFRTKPLKSLHFDSLREKTM